MTVSMTWRWTFPETSSSLEPGQVVGQSAYELYAEVPAIVAGIERAIAAGFCGATAYRVL